MVSPLPAVNFLNNYISAVTSYYDGTYTAE